MGAENDIHKCIDVFYFLNLFFFLHHTAAHGNDHIRILLFVRLQSAQTSVHTDIGIFPHGTGIIIDKIRVLVVRRHIADLLQNPVELL